MRQVRKRRKHDRYRGVEARFRQAANAMSRALIYPRRPDAAPDHEQARPPGAAPGIEQLAATAGLPTADSVRVQLLEYDTEEFLERDIALEQLSAELQAAPARPGITRWINVNGLSPYIVAWFKEHFGLHTLAAEDVLHRPQRPRAQAYGDQLYVVARMLQLRDAQLHGEQISFFLLPRQILLTFQEESGDVWEPVRQRIRAGIPRIRRSGADYLLYALLDALVDHGFPLLEAYGDQLEELEDRILDHAEPGQLSQLHHIKRELTLLRRVLWPTRDLVDGLHRDEAGYLSEETRTFMRDVHDHGVQLLDMVETFREMATGLSELHMHATNQRMNEIMKTLTIMASIFIPITFLAGVYGMNFEHMPELPLRWAYPALWLVFVSVAVGLLLVFRRRRWF